MVVIICTVLTFLLLIGFDQYQHQRQKNTSYSPLGISLLMATGIGLHNFGEGLAIGSSFALGEAALGTFLIIGFTLHNITEGVGIAAPLLKDRPTWKTFVKLALIAGGPAIIGMWACGFIFNDSFSAFFFGIGAGAILQVIYVISKMILRESEKRGLSPVSWMNFGGLTAGILIMYVTALMVKF